MRPQVLDQSNSRTGSENFLGMARSWNRCLPSLCSVILPMGTRFCPILTLPQILYHELVLCLQRRAVLCISARPQPHRGAHCWVSMSPESMTLGLEAPRSPDTHRGTKAQTHPGAVGHEAGGGVARHSEGGTVKLKVRFQPGEVGGKVPRPGKLLRPTQGDWRSRRWVRGTAHSLLFSCRLRMQALVLLLWTGALLAHSSCQDSAGSPQEVSGVGARRGVGNPHPSLAGSKGDGTDTPVPGQTLAFLCR